MSALYTPGPWRLEEMQVTQGWAIWSGLLNAPDEYRIAGIGKFVPSAEQAEANARLIAAAPELLAVLVKIAASDFYVPKVSTLRPELDAAIAKATGAAS